MIAAVTPAKLRRAQRRAHLLAAAVLLAYVYAPLESELQDFVRFAVFPALALTGIAMWQAPASAGSRGASAAPPPARFKPATTGRNGQMQFRELDERVTYGQQLQEKDGGPVVLINVFNVASEDAQRFLDAWAAFMKRQPGFVSAQLHRGTAGSSTFVNVAEWESASALGEAFRSPEFQAGVARYPDGAVASPHVFERIGVPGI